MRRPTVFGGECYGRLFVMGEAHSDDRRPGQRSYSCRCSCGRQVVVAGDKLRSGKTRSCGCLRREVMAKVGRAHGAANGRAGLTTHGMTRSPTYASWQSMIARCTRRSNNRYDRYGGANPPVLVCARWLPSAGGSFENFLADLGERPEGTTLGRFGDGGDYEGTNCSWQTPTQQKAEQRQKRKKP